MWCFICSSRACWEDIFILSTCYWQEKHELAERVMITRLHLYSKWIKVCGMTYDRNYIILNLRMCTICCTLSLCVCPMLRWSHQGYILIKDFEEIIGWPQPSNIFHWMGTLVIFLCGLPILGSLVKSFNQEDICSFFIHKDQDSRSPEPGPTFT